VRAPTVPTTGADVLLAIAFAVAFIVSFPCKGLQGMKVTEVNKGDMTEYR
jgi:hypothetical protein